MVNKKTRERIVNSLWGIIEARKLTWDNLADGTDIAFSFNGKTYRINSKVVSCPRIISMDDFSKRLEKRSIQEVENENICSL